MLRTHQVKREETVRADGPADDDLCGTIDDMANKYQGLFSEKKDRTYFYTALRHLLEKGVPEEKIAELLESGAVGEVIVRVVENAAGPLVETLKSDAPAMLSRRHKDLAEFQEHLYGAYKNGLDLFEMLLVIACEVGEGLSRQWKWFESPEDDIWFDVMRRLHARGCLVAGEVLALLKAGFPAGAHARWRTLHETAVVALFVGERGKDTAKRYLDHADVETYKAALSYQAHCITLGHEPYGDEEMEEMRALRDAALARYGREFIADYGWASQDLGHECARFSDLEDAVTLDHLRPYYRVASYPVHANAKSILFNVGLEKDDSDVPLNGPSATGLTDPAHCSAISLFQLTAAYLQASTTSDSILMMHAMGQIVSEVGEEFLEARRKAAGTRRTISGQLPE